MQKRNQIEDRPRLEIVPDYWDQVLDYLGWGICVILIAFAVYLFTSPVIVTGTADLKISVLILSLLGVGMAIGFHYLKKIPHRFNYLVRITPQNAGRQYRLALRMIRMINLFILLEFIAILVMTYYEKPRQVQVDVGLVVVVVMILGFIPVGYYHWKSMEKPSKN